MRSFALLALVVGLTALSPADEPQKKQDAQSTYEPKSGPGEGQKFLEKFVGDFDVTKAFHPRGGGEPSRATGECKQFMIHNGRFLQSDFTFGTGAEKSTGMGLTGFDPTTGKFTTVWTDSRQTKMSFRQSQDKFDGEQIVLFSQSFAGDEGRKSKTVTKLENNGSKIVHKQFNMSPDGQERLVMELTLTRKTFAK